MKKEQNKISAQILYCSSLLYSILILFTGNGCHPSGRPNKNPDHKDNYNRYDTAYPLIIWKNPNVSETTFTDELNAFKASLNGTVTNTVFCKECDDHLQQLSGAGPLNFIQGQTASGGSTSGGGGRVSGDGEYPFYYSANFFIKLPELDEKNEDVTQIVSAPKQAGYTDGPVTTAVFDTGLDPVLLSNDNSYLAGITSACLPPGNHGWNFTQNNPITKDDNAEKHGTVVTDFIIEQANKFHKNSTRVLPVKTHWGNGSSNLFYVLCGFAYIANSGTKVINASFGYYSYGDNSCTLLFKKYIEFYLTKNNILLICAAGNQDSEADKAIKIVKGPGIDPRNLEINPFYPACFSRDLQNVITVTTVNATSHRVSFSQNYSRKYVDIGVNCDMVVGLNCNLPSNTCKLLFVNPVRPGSAINGSSYATPIVCGKISANYSTLTVNGIDKSKIIAQMLMPATPIGSIDNALKSKIRGGIVVKK